MVGPGPIPLRRLAAGGRAAPKARTSRIKRLHRRRPLFGTRSRVRARWPWLIVLLATGITGAAITFARRVAPPPRPVPNRAFHTAKRPNAPATVWAVGDGADGGRDARAVARRIAAGRPDRLLFLGDVYPDGTASDFRGGYASVYGSLAGRTAPTPGNHDWPNHDVGYDPYWRSVTGAPTPPWYAFRIGGWKVLSLNSEAPHGAASAQLRWLRARLRQGDGTCRLAFWHRPLHSAGLHGDQNDVAPLEDALVGHAALVLNGHDHDLQRFGPARGLVSVVVGAGGHGRYGVNSGDARLAFENDSVYGALRMRLQPGRATLELLAANGRSLDRSSVGCRPAIR